MKIYFTNKRILYIDLYTYVVIMAKWYPLIKKFIQ